MLSRIKSQRKVLLGRSYVAVTAFCVQAQGQTRHAVRLSGGTS